MCNIIISSKNGVNIMKKIRLIYNKSAGQNKSSEIVSDIIGKFNENDFAICQAVKTEQKFALVCAGFVR